MRPETPPRDSLRVRHGLADEMVSHCSSHAKDYRVVFVFFLCLHTIFLLFLFFSLALLLLFCFITYASYIPLYLPLFSFCLSLGLFFFLIIILPLMFFHLSYFSFVLLLCFVEVLALEYIYSPYLQISSMISFTIRERCNLKKWYRFIIGSYSAQIRCNHYFVYP